MLSSWKRMSDGCDGWGEDKDLGARPKLAVSRDALLSRYHTKIS